MRALLCLTILVLALEGFAQPGKQGAQGNTFAPVLDPEKEGLALAEKLTLAYPTETVEFSGTLLLRRGGKSLERVPIRSRLVALGTNWQMIYQTGPVGLRPAEKLVVVHTPGKPNRYLHTSGTAPETNLTSLTAEIPLAGSHFWLTDLGLEFLQWPDQRLVRHETTRSRACHVLESRPGTSASSHYSLVRSWIDLESGGVIRAEAYSSDQKLWKEFGVDTITKVNNQWRVERMRMESRSTNTTSVIEFDLKGR